MPEKVCPCCKKMVPDMQPDDVMLAFHDLLRTNDIRLVFKITGDRRFIFAPDIEPREAAESFAAMVDDYLRQHAYEDKAALAEAADALRAVGGGETDALADKLAARVARMRE